MTDFEGKWRNWLEARAGEGRLRTLRAWLPAGVVDFSSNDYLSLTRHPALTARAQQYLTLYGSGAGAARLVTGNLPPYGEIETKLAAAKGAEAALVFVSGFQANSTILPALLDKRILGVDPLVFADRLIHASMIKGLRAAGIMPRRFRHNDLSHLEELLQASNQEARPRFILTETVFSMEGDRSDVDALVALAEKYDAFLYLDEAHATGMFGENGFGLACNRAGPRCLVMGTFGKALGSFGAYAATTRVLRDYLVNRCTGLVYATALPPSLLGAIEAAIELVPSLGTERARTLAHAERFRHAMHDHGFDTADSTTQIVPVILGAEARALSVARALESEGLLCIAIRPPTVPENTSRIRFAFSARHSDDEVTSLIDAFVRLAAKVPA